MIKWELLFEDENETIIDITDIDILYEITQSIMRGNTEGKIERWAKSND